MPDAASRAAAAPGLEPEFYQRLFEGAGLAILVCDAQGAIRAWNPLAEPLLRQSSDEPRGRHVRELLPSRDREALDEALRSLRDTHEPVELRTQIQVGRRDPTQYAVWLTPILGAPGVLEGITVWFHDITARVELRRGMRKRERLTALGALSGAIAHHFNNLLGSIATSLDYAMNMNTISAMRRALQRTAEAVARGAQLTQQLLAFAQGDYRSSRRADLAGMLRSYAESQRPRIAQHGVELKLELEPIPPLEVLSEQFLIVLNNLVNNALEAMPAGGTLTLSLAPHGPDQVRVSVADTGPGIPAEHMERLFEPFFTTKGELGAGATHQLGMGLAVAHGLVSELHGTISARNRPGGGAQFDIVLPVPQAAPPAEGP